MNQVERVARGHYTIHTELEIAAPDELVWATLTDFEQMAEWSSSIKRMDHEFRAGGRITVKLNAMRFTRSPEHDVLDFEDGVQFGWSDPFLLAMVEHHLFRVEPLTKGASGFISTDQVKVERLR